MFPRHFDPTLNRVICGAMIGAAFAVFTGTALAARISAGIHSSQSSHWTGLDCARASYDSIHGPIIVLWRQDRGTLFLDTSIPANVTAIIYLPARDAAKIKESGRYVKEVDDVTLAGVEADRAILRAGSGEYHFTTPYAAEGLVDLLGHK